MESILYLGLDDGGIVTLRSRDSRSWEAENHSLKNWTVTEVAAVPSAPNRVFAGTRGDGVWISEDFGKSWKKPCYGKHGPGKVRCLTFDPKDSRLYAGCEPIDLFVSDDLGKSWSRAKSIWEVPSVASVSYPVSTVEPHIRDVTVDPKDSRKIYVSLQVGHMLKSEDGGATWKLLDRDLDADVHFIVIHPASTDKLFISTGGHECRSGRVKGRALYASNDAGESWAPMAVDFAQEYSLPLVMHPNNPDVLYSGMANGHPPWRRPSGAESIIIRTKDGGQRWERLEDGLSEASKSFPGAITFDEGSPDHIYAGFKNGEIYSSKDSGDCWEKLDVKVSAIADMQCVQA